MSKDKVAAYAQQQKRNLTPREVEAMAFTKAALLLEDAKKSTGNIEEYSKALRTTNGADLDVLININRNLAAGLRTSPQTAAAQAPAEPMRAAANESA
jgi:flagellar protein FlaF